MAMGFGWMTQRWISSTEAQISVVFYFLAFLFSAIEYFAKKWTNSKVLVACALVTLTIAAVLMFDSLGFLYPSYHFHCLTAIVFTSAFSTIAILLLVVG